jgi:late competence protein required for DNA uptake (superfamily II DNA/RNA helicase)
VANLPNPPLRCMRCKAELNQFSETEEHIKAKLCRECFEMLRHFQRARLEQETGRLKQDDGQQTSLF